MTNKKENIIPRPPVVVVMGHIDHGKSTLLDYIRKTNIVEKEFGGITQHISAYEVEHKREDGKIQKITFLDTPGHEAFKAMRSRGAAVADVAILVVSAEDGVKQQTLEALNAITEGGLPYIVAINKIDKPNANIDKTKQTLAENGIYIEGYGGTVPCALISAKHGNGVPELLDTIVLLADLEELIGDTELPGEGFIIESTMDPRKGITASVIIKNGSLKSSDCVVSGESICSLRMMEDFTGKKITSATMSSPVRIIGWSTLPKIGNSFRTCLNKKEAEAAAKLDNEGATNNTRSETFDSKVSVPIIIRADTAGVADTIEQEIIKLNNEEVSFKILSKGTGAISEGDIKVALPFEKAITIGFNTKIEPRAKDLADRNNIIVKIENVIYKLTEWLGEVAKERKLKVEVEEVRGQLKVLKTFSEDKDRRVVGGRVLSGTISINDQVRIIRRDNEIGRGEISELQQAKSKTKSVSEGECGMEIKSKFSISEGDIIESVKKVIK